MLKFLSFGVLLLTSSITFANNYPTTAYTKPLLFSGAVEYSQYQATLENDLDLDFKGVAFTISNSPHISGWYAKLEILQNDEFDMDYVETVTGGQMSLFRDPNFYATVSAGIGYAWLDSSYLYNNVQFFTLPVGVEVGMTPMANFSIFGGVGYKWAWDLTSNTTCRDGSTTNSTGRGSCAYRGGVDYYNEPLGDLAGATYKAGIRVNF